MRFLRQHVLMAELASSVLIRSVRIAGAMNLQIPYLVDFTEEQSAFAARTASWFR